MRRFIRTFTVRRHAMFVVRQDGDAYFYAVVRWAAEDDAPEEVCRFDYKADDRESGNDARVRAMKEASRLATAETLGNAERLIDGAT